MNYLEIKNQASLVVNEIIEKAKLRKGNVLVVGCSSSEVLGDKIGTNSSIDVANAIFEGIYPILNEKGIFLAVQCCEHLNRAIVIEKDAFPNAEPVNVVPQKKSGRFSCNGCLFKI